MIQQNQTFGFVSSKNGFMTWRFKKNLCEKNPEIPRRYLQCHGPTKTDGKTCGENGIQNHAGRIGAWMDGAEIEKNMHYFVGAYRFICFGGFPLDFYFYHSHF